MRHVHRRRDLPSDLELLATAQARCVSRAQLREHGVDADLVARRVRAGAWQRAGSLVVVLHAEPLGPQEERWAASLWAAPGGVVAGLSALAVHGLRSWERTGVDLVVPRHASRGGPEWVRCRTTTRWDPDDLTSRDGLPVHRVERAALDAAAWLPSSRAAGGLVAAVVQQRLTTADRLLSHAASTGLYEYLVDTARTDTVHPRRTIVPRASRRGPTVPLAQADGDPQYQQGEGCHGEHEPASPLGGGLAPDTGDVA